MHRELKLGTLLAIVRQAGVSRVLVEEQGGRPG
jgi:hypothetical protein